MAQKIIMFFRYYVPRILSFRVSRPSNRHYHNLNHNDTQTQVSVKPKPYSFITDTEIQSEFSHHAPGVARINNGSFGCCPASVISSLHQWQLKLLRQPDDFYLNELPNRILESRTVIKDLINAEDVEEVSIVDNVSTAVAIVLKQMAWSFVEGKFDKGDAIIMFRCTYGAVKNSIKAYFLRAGGCAIEVPFNFPVTSNEEIVSEFKAALRREKGIKKRNHETVVEMGQMLAKAWGTHLGCPPEMCASMIMIGLPACLGILSEKDTQKLRTHLRETFGVEVPIYFRPPKNGEIESINGYCRISHQVYNKVDDYYKFRDAVNQLVSEGFTCAQLSS